MAELKCAVCFFVFSLHRWSQCTKASDSFLLWVLLFFSASIIAPVFLYKLFFTNLVFSVLGGSLLRCAVFPVLFSID